MGNGPDIVSEDIRNPFRFTLEDRTFKIPLEITELFICKELISKLLD